MLLRQDKERTLKFVALYSLIFDCAGRQVIVKQDDKGILPPSCFLVFSGQSQGKEKPQGNSLSDYEWQNFLIHMRKI